MAHRANPSASAASHAASSASRSPCSADVSTDATLPRYSPRRKYAEMSARVAPSQPLLSAANLLKALTHLFHRRPADNAQPLPASAVAALSGPGDASCASGSASPSCSSASGAQPVGAPLSVSYVPTDLLRIIAGMAETDASEEADAHRERIWPVHGVVSQPSPPAVPRPAAVPRPPLHLFRVRPATGGAFEWRLRLSSKGTPAFVHRWCTRPLMWLWAPSFAHAFVWLHGYMETQSDDVSLSDAVDHSERLTSTLGDDDQEQRTLMRRFRTAVGQLGPFLNPPADGDEQAARDREERFPWSDALMTSELFRDYASLLRSRGIPTLEIQPHTQFHIYREMPDQQPAALCPGPASAPHVDEHPLWLLTSTRLDPKPGPSNDEHRYYCWIRGGDRRGVWRWIMLQRARGLLFPWLDWKELLRCVNRQTTSHWAANPLSDAEIDRWDELVRADPKGLSPALEQWQYPNGLHYLLDPIWVGDKHNRVSEARGEPARRFH